MSMAEPTKKQLSEIIKYHWSKGDVSAAVRAVRYCLKDSRRETVKLRAAMFVLENLAQAHEEGDDKKIEIVITDSRKGVAQNPGAGVET
jgi:hypothetical protein